MYEQSPRRSPARYLAPLALAAILVAVYLVVQHAGGPSPPAGAGTRSNQTSTRSSGSGGSTKKGSHRSKFYRVKSGDSLSVISARTGVPLPQLESLNPGVSTSSLQVGQRLRLRR